MRHLPEPSRRSPAGFTLVEVLLTTLIVGLAVVGAMSAMSQAATTKHVLEDEPLTALALASEIHALALALPTGDGDGSPATTAAGVSILDDLDGASFSPPLDAKLQGISEASGWRQDIQISTVSLADPSVDLPDDAGSASLLKLQVSVSDASSVKGTYTWWLNP